MPDTYLPGDTRQHLLPSLQALASGFERQYSGLQIESDDLFLRGFYWFFKSCPYLQTGKRESVPDPCI